MVAPSEAETAPATDGRHPDAMDCILQLPSSSLAYRLTLYHADPDTRHRLYPGGGSDDVVELGMSVPGGDQLVLFRRLAVPPLDFKRWLDASFVRHSCTRAYFLGSLEAANGEVSRAAVATAAPRARLTPCPLPRRKWRAPSSRTALPPAPCASTRTPRPWSGC